MDSYSALATFPDRTRAEAAAQAMEGLDPPPTGIGVFEIEDGSGRWEVGGFFDAPPDAASLAILEAAFGGEFVTSVIPRTDWVAHVRRELTPVRAGRFFVHGSHDADAVPEGAIPLLIEASMAFGTGHHGTTLGCLRALDRLAEAGEAPKQVADIGCGTAVLAMAAAHLWSTAQVVASDIDPVAVEVARANLAANGLAGRIELIEAAGLDDPRLSAPFDLVVANILMGPLLEMAPAIVASIAPRGALILSGLLNEQADRVSAHYCALGVNEEGRESIVDWTTVILRQES